ncbi:MAG: conjugal transfer protein TraG [Segetibacter sp.]|nr:conjugal transfer protein TraG [Segetibacter sp.]
MQVDYDSLFTVLRAEKEIEVLINPFITACLNDAMEQVEGQIASAKVAMARLSSPQLYYMLSVNDFTLDINNPDELKMVCMGNCSIKNTSLWSSFIPRCDTLSEAGEQKRKAEEQPDI